MLYGSNLFDLFYAISIEFNCKVEDIFFLPNQKLEVIKTDKFHDFVSEIGKHYGWEFAMHYEIFVMHDYDFIPEMKIKKDDVVLDIGANIGIFSRFAALNGAKKVYSIEMDKRYFEALLKNSQLYDVTIPANYCVTNNNETIEYRYNEANFGGSTVKGILKEDDKIDKAKCITVNEFIRQHNIERINFMKLDVEGSEVDILYAISDESFSKIDKISLEYHHAFLGGNEDDRQRLINWVCSKGFRYYLLFMGHNQDLQMIYFYR